MQCENIQKQDDGVDDGIEYQSVSRQISRNSHQRCSVRKGVLKNFAKFTGNTCARISFLIKLPSSACNFIKKRDSGTGVSCEFCKIFKDVFFTEHLWATTSR